MQLIPVRTVPIDKPAAPSTVRYVVDTKPVGQSDSALSGPLDQRIANLADNDDVTIREIAAMRVMSDASRAWRFALRNRLIFDRVQSPSGQLVLALRQAENDRLIDVRRRLDFRPRMEIGAM